MTISALYFLYGGEYNSVSSNSPTSYPYSFSAPFEVLIGGIFLYQSVGIIIRIFFVFQFSFDSCRLLGLSAFAGFIVLLVGWPLNSLLARWNIRIQKGVLAARDKRMGVLDELISAVCIFFFIRYCHSIFFITYVLL